LKANFSHFGKEQYRRSILPESVVDFVDEQIKQEITLIDLGKFLISDLLETTTNRSFFLNALAKIKIELHIPNERSRRMVYIDL